MPILKKTLHLNLGNSFTSLKSSPSNRFSGHCHVRCHLYLISFSQSFLANIKSRCGVLFYPLSPKNSILPLLVSEVPTPCRTIRLLLHEPFQFCCLPPGGGGGALPMVEYTGRLPPKGVTFLSLHHSERLEKSLS